MTHTIPTNVTEVLTPLLRPGQSLCDVLDTQNSRQLNDSWQQLQEMGFELEVGTESIRVRHGSSGYETVIHLSRGEDLGELRHLFLSLRGQFGRLRERLFPWFFLPGTAVTAPYTHLRHLTAACQMLRQARSSPS